MSNTPDLHILILAAGAASRMRGADKLLETVDGTPLLTRIAQAAISTGHPVWVALPPDRPARNAALDGLALHCVLVTDAQLGMASSIRAGLGAISPHAAVMLLLADLPEIEAGDLARMADAQTLHPQAILRATDAGGRPGHPVIFPPWSRAALSAISGDEGARMLLRSHAAQVRMIALKGAHATTDLDTPEDWAAWRARTGR